MSIWKLNFVPFGFAHVPIWVLAEDQALEPRILKPAAAQDAVPAVPVPESAVPEPAIEASVPDPGREPSGFRRFVDRFVDALVRFGDRSYEAKVRSGRLNRYYY